MEDMDIEDIEMNVVVYFDKNKKYFIGIYYYEIIFINIFDYFDYIY